MSDVITLASLRTHSLAPLSGRPPESVVLFLHGLGADGADLISLGAAWATALPNTQFLSPDAPFPCDMAPYGYQWFSLLERTSEALLRGVQSAEPILNALIEAICETYHLSANKVALVGFSQGTMTSLYVAPRRAQSVACVLGFSGLLLGAETLAQDKKSSPDVLLFHGTDDEVLPFSALAAAEAGLKASSIPVRAIACAGLGHGIDETGVREGATFLQSHLVSQSAS